MTDGPGRTVLCGPVYHSAQWAYLVPADDHRIGHGHAAQVRQRRRARADRRAPGHQHPPRADADEAADRPARRREGVASTARRCSSCCTVRRRVRRVVKQAMIDWWGPMITEYYGSTEGSVITMIDSEEWLAKGGSVGKPLAEHGDHRRRRRRHTARPERVGHALLPQRDGHRLRVPQRAGEDRRQPTSNPACSPPATSATSTTTATCG